MKKKNVFRGLKTLNSSVNFLKSLTGIYLTAILSNGNESSQWIDLKIDFESFWFLYSNRWILNHIWCHRPLKIGRDIQLFRISWKLCPRKTLSPQASSNTLLQHCIQSGFSNQTDTSIVTRMENQFNNFIFEYHTKQRYYKWVMIIVLEFWAKTNKMCIWCCSKSTKRSMMLFSILFWNWAQVT